MRSGSTLLKALLAEAPDISNLPEKDFQKFCGDNQAAEKLAGLDEHPIIVLKRPGWYNEIGRYPKLPTVAGLKTIVLIRDVYATVESLRKMTFRKLAPMFRFCADGWLAKRYWLGITQSLLELHEDSTKDTHLVRYEDLTANPIEETQKLFAFVGSSQTTGVDTYSQPADFRWRWGSDDNSANIKSLKVQSRPPKTMSNTRLVNLMSDPAIAELREKLGYPPIGE
jgi:hypothetical protein